MRWVGRDHYDIYPSVQLSGKRLSRTARAICDTGEAPTLITGQVGSQAASPAAPETDTGERVHSSSRINL